MLTLRRFDSISVPGGKVNLDLCAYKRNYFWVIDGATALVPLDEEDPTYEVNTLVHNLDRAIRETMDDSLSLSDIMRESSGIVQKESGDMGSREPWQVPSCAVALVRILEDNLEYFVLGDVVVAVCSPQVEVVTDTALLRLDKIAIAEKMRLQSTGMTSREARAAITPILRKHRSMMNRPDGYWIFNGDPEAIKHARTGVITLGRSGQFLLATDGFSRLVDLFHHFASWDELLNALRENSLEDLARTLRQIEKDDTECLKFPRFSTHDDATAVYGEL